MKFKFLFLAFFSFAVLVASCAVRTLPAQPNDGYYYFHPYHNTHLYYDANLRVYLVRNYPHCYYYDGYYYHYIDGYWYYSPNIRTTRWRRTRSSSLSVPKPLIKRYNQPGYPPPRFREKNSNRDMERSSPRDPRGSQPSHRPGSKGRKK